MTNKDLNDRSSRMAQAVPQHVNRLSASTAALVNGKQVVDVHTHMYLPSLMDIMRSRTNLLPRVVPDGKGGERLIILPGEDKTDSTASGRPIGDEYWSVERKLEFMDIHGISSSIVSTANPWLDFLQGQQQVDAAIVLNNELSQMHLDSHGRLYGFCVLPLTDIPAATREVYRIASLPGVKGIILGTHGAGIGMDDVNLLPVYSAIAETQLVVFVHPHYGIDQEHFGETGSAMGHVFPLALGFTFETTIAISRLILAGVFDKIPDLKLLLAHSGGTLPFLAGRLDSCVEHDHVAANKLLHPPSYYLKKLYYDSVCYHEPALRCLLAFADEDKIMFGTDNPFFPPLEEQSKAWKSVESNYESMRYLEESVRDKILWKNAQQLFGL